MQRLQPPAASGGIEVLYTVIESLTQDGRDRSLDYKISGLDVPRGSWDAKVIDAHRARRGRDRLPQNLLLRLHLHQHRLRAAQPRRALPDDGRRASPTSASTAPSATPATSATSSRPSTDACATLTQERHDWSLRNNRGYCRQRTTAEVVAEIERLTSPRLQTRA